MQVQGAVMPGACGAGPVCVGGGGPGRAVAGACVAPAQERGRGTPLGRGSHARKGARVNHVVYGKNRSWGHTARPAQRQGDGRGAEGGTRAASERDKVKEAERRSPS